MTEPLYQSEFARNFKLRQALLLGLSLFTLWIDYATGPTILFPIWFALPVLITAWYDGLPLASTYAVLLPLGRLAMKLFWPSIPWPMSHSVINFGIRILALELIAYLAARNGQLTRQLRVLTGLIYICMYCHRIRTDEGHWERLEAYMERNSEASFTHGICPDCHTQGR